MTKIVNSIAWGAAIVVASSLAIVMPAFAQTSVNVGASVGAQVGIHDGANGGRRFGGGSMMPAGVFGTVTAINGDTLTVTSKAWARPNSTSTPAASASTVYTVDASNATIYKGSATTTVSVSSIATGDTVMVQGTVTGTNVAATIIRDGFPRPMGGPMMPPGKGFEGRGNGTSTPPVSPITGNGEPVVGGNITAVSGTMLTITNASNVTYTIDASAATLVKNGTSTAITNLAVGDSVIVQGTVNGTSVTASSVIDQGVKGTNATSTVKVKGGVGFGFGGIFGAIGGFFQHLFGF
jgi:hypothetical protein